MFAHHVYLINKSKRDLALNNFPWLKTKQTDEELFLTFELCIYVKQKNAACNPEQVLAATPHKTPTVRPPAPYHENYSS